MSWKRWENTKICRVESPAVLWVKLLDIKSEPIYQYFIMLQHQLDITFHNRQKEDHKKYDLGKTIDKDQPAIVCHNDSWCRCIILDVNEPTKNVKQIDTFLVDYGEHITVLASYVYPLAAGMWSSIPYLCRRIQLVGTAPAEMCFMTDDGTEELCFKAGKFWSPASIRFMKEIARTEHTCQFQPAAPFVDVNNDTTWGNIYLQITPPIRNLVYGYNYESYEPLELLENLSDLLVSCKMAVLFSEDLTNQFVAARKVLDESYGQHRNVNALGKKNLDQEPINFGPLLDENEHIERTSELKFENQFRMDLSHVHGADLNSLTKNDISPISLSRSISTDLSEIPLPSFAQSDVLPLNSSSFSAVDEFNKSSFKNSLTGYEKKVRVSSKIEVPISSLKQVEVESKVAESNPINEPDLDKSNATISRSLMSNFSRPIFALAKLRLVYNYGKIPVTRDELIRDEADARKVINRTVLEILKQYDFRVLPLQTYMWPAVVRGRSCVAVERRSHGKTLGFLIPLVSHMLDSIKILRMYAPKSSGPLAIIVCPGWSTATNVATLLEDLTRFSSLRVAAVYGGMSKSSNEEDQKGMFSIDILVTTMPSLPRLGLPLLEEKLLYDTIPCISLDKCSFLVFDNFETTYEKFQPLTDCLIDKWLMTVQESETIKEIIITSKQWNADVENVAEKISIMNPNILISSIFEAAVASLVKTRLDCCKSDVLVSQAVCDAVINYAGKKVIVFLNGPQAAERLQELLNTKAIYTICVTSADKPVVKMAMDLWTNSRCCVMLILEVAFIEYMASGIKDADVIIHASIPPGIDHLGMRYSYMLDKFEKVDRGEATCISHFILTPEMIINKPRIIQELQRLGIEIADKVKDAYDEGIRRLKLNAATQELCFSHKSFGKCPENNCNMRHYLIPEDEPKLLPSDGQVKLEIIDVISASCFLARIRCYRNTEGCTTDLEKVYQRVHNMLQEFYRVKENRKCIDNAKEGSFCALEKQAWVRGEIIMVDFSENRVIYTVKMIDEHGLVERSSDSLYKLPDALNKVPPLAVEVYLINIKPVDKDSHFTDYAKHMASSRLLNRSSETYFTAVISFSIRNTIFVRELIEIRTIAKIQKETSYLSRELVQNRLATTNPTHLDDLAVDNSDRAVQFTCSGDNWLKKYESLENPFYTANSEPMIDIEKDRGSRDDSSSISSGTSTLVNSSEAVSDIDLPKNTKKIDAVKSLMRLYCPKKSPVENRGQNLTNFSDSDNIVNATYTNHIVGPPPPCVTPEYLSDQDDIISYSNFDYVPYHKQPTSSDMSFESSMFSANSISLPLNEVIEVTVGEICSPNSFFVIKYSNSNILTSLEQEIQKNVTKFTPFDPDGDISGLHIAQFSDKMYYRGLLSADSQEGTCNVNFVDYGDRMVISWDKIFKCPSALCKIPYQAIHCELDNIKVPRKQVIAAKNHMEKLSNSHGSWKIKPVSVAKHTDGTIRYAVEMFTKTEKGVISMANTLVESGYAEIYSKSSEQKELKNEKLELRNERINRLINERQFINSPTETIKEFLFDDIASAVSDVINNGDDEESVSSKLSKPPSIASVLKHMRLNNCSSPGINRGDMDVVEYPPANENEVEVGRQDVHNGNEMRNIPLLDTKQHNIFHPHTIWKDTDTMVILRFQLVGVLAYSFDPSEQSVAFSTTLNGTEYVFNDTLFSKIIPAGSSCAINAREVVVKVNKEIKGRSWPRLLSIEGRIPWLKRDVPSCSSVCSSSANRSVAWENTAKKKLYGGLPAGISDDDTSLSESTLTDGDSELFKFG